MGTPGYMSGRALARFFHAIFGGLLLIGPFAVLLFRGLSLGLVVTVLLVAASYAFAAWRYRNSGLSYLRELASDTLTAMAAAIGAAGASIVLARLTRIHLHTMFLPAVVVGTFWYLEYRAARHHAAFRETARLGRADHVVEFKKMAKNAALSLHRVWRAPAEFFARSSKP